MQRGGRIAPKRRSADEAERIYGPFEFREWLHLQPCAVCGERYDIEQAHAKTGGTGRKADWMESLPMCGPRLVPTFPIEFDEGCHRELHRVGVRSFERIHRVKLSALVASTQRAWAAFSGARGGGGRPA